MRHALVRGLSCLGLGLLACASAAAEDGWVTLFNGENLNNWVQQGGKAEYTIEEGTIVGTAVPNTPNSFLCTKRHYRDFELEVDFLVNPEMNSGIQIRSNAYSADSILTWFVVEDEQVVWKEYKVPAGRVHGYQVEIDPSDRAWSGGIYDEGRRGWLNDLKDNEPARQAFKQNEWNHYRVLCEGDHIQTWINDVPAADLHDGMTPSGFIALQVHGIGDKEPEQPLQVKWRNIRLREIIP
jgi:hypothetical protein